MEHGIIGELDVKIQMPFDEIKALLDVRAYRSSEFCHDVFDTLGGAIIKNAFSKKEIQVLLQIYHEALLAGCASAENFHPTAVTFPFESVISKAILASETFKNIVKPMFGNNVGVDYIRVVRKDGDNMDPVFLHQDCAYQKGPVGGRSAFIALTKCDPTNGAIVGYAGTHKFGYLGDAGEIRRHPLLANIEFTASLAPGDVFIMDSSIWHESHKSQTGNPRILLEVHLLPADYPTVKHVITGRRTSKFFLDGLVDDIFVSSRVQKLRQFYNNTGIEKS